MRTSLDRAPDPELTACYGVRPARFRHALAGDDLFSHDALLEAVGRWPESSMELRDHQGAPPVATRERAAAALASVSRAPAWIVLKELQDDPRYRPVVLDACRTVLELSRAQERDLVLRAHVFVASAGVETPLHADDDQGFLLHVRGGKELTLYEMGERHFSPARARAEAGTARVFELPEGWPVRAHTFRLEPGDAAHIPWHWPHRARSLGPDHSVSVNVSIESARTQALLRVSNANDVLAACGLRPRAVGSSPPRDWLKHRAWPMLSRLAGRRAAPWLR